MRREERRFRRKARAKLSPQPAARVRVKPGARFVENHDIRVRDKRERERNAALFAAREAAHARFCIGLQAERLEDVIHIGGVRIVPGGESDQFANLQRVGKAGRLRRARDGSAKLRRSGIGPAQAEQDLEGGRLSGPVWAEQRPHIRPAAR